MRLDIISFVVSYHSLARYIWCLDVDVVLSSEKPRAKLRDSFTHQSEEIDAAEDVSSTTAAAMEFKEPIISQRSQTLKDIIRIHEQGSLSSDYLFNIMPTSTKNLRKKN